MLFYTFSIGCDDLYFALICDNRFLLKVTEAGKALLPNCEMQLPYEGSKQPMFLVLDLDNQKFLKQLIQATCAQLPPPKPKKRKLKL
ncbi:MAG: TfoX/Sxy family protein [Saezia sp.]